MLSKIAKQSVKHCSRFPQKSFSTAVKPRSFLNHYKKLTVFGGFGLLLSYDYFGRDAETIGGAIRFARSLKVAVEISADYNFRLYGLDENSEEYEKVKHEKMFLIKVHLSFLL